MRLLGRQLGTVVSPKLFKDIGVCAGFTSKLFQLLKTIDRQVLHSQ